MSPLFICIVHRNLLQSTYGSSNTRRKMIHNFVRVLTLSSILTLQVQIINENNVFFWKVIFFVSSKMRKTTIFTEFTEYKLTINNLQLRWMWSAIGLVQFNDIRKSILLRSHAYTRNIIYKPIYVYILFRNCKCV